MNTNAKHHLFNDSNSLFQAFHRNGYLTSMFGKLTNDMTGFFCNSDPPMVKGLDRVQAPCDYNDFYGLQLSTLLKLVISVFMSGQQYCCGTSHDLFPVFVFC